VSAERGVLALFGKPDAAALAIRSLRASGLGDVRVAMPAPFPEVVAALGMAKSPVGYLALPGAAFGILCGLALTIGTSLAWPLVTGGLPVVSIPPFIVITFELTVLLGALGNLMAVSFGTWHGARQRSFPGGGTFNGNRIAVFASGGEPGVAERILRECGAEEITDAP
jgi:hypothetical protein